MQISISENAKRKNKKKIYSDSKKLIIGILAHFLHFKMAIACLFLEIPLPG